MIRLSAHLSDSEEREVSKREAVQTGTVLGGSFHCLWGHVDHCPRDTRHGTGSLAWLEGDDTRVPQITDLGHHGRVQEHVLG